MKHELQSQIDRFQMLMGQKPTHIDGHQHAHLLPGMFYTFMFISTNRSLIEIMYYVICLRTTWQNNYNLYLKLKDKHSYVI